MNSAVFFDRDGLLSEPIVKAGIRRQAENINEFKISIGALEMLLRLKKEGFFVIAITSQPDAAFGPIPKHVVDEINNKLMEDLPIDDVCTCLHSESDQCFCRKPEPGLLLEASRDWKVNLQESYLVGDQWKDIEAGRRAGCQTIFVNQGIREAMPVNPHYEVRSLVEAVDWIVSNKRFRLR